jgi:membrane-bound inhibitor of C-type lysozyme
MRIAVAAIMLALAATPALAQDQPPPAAPAPSAPATTSSIVITLAAAGDADRKLTTYQCNGRDAPLTVEYVDVQPNYLALVPLDAGTLVFASVLSGSGARYASGQWIWWTKGSNANLYDVTKGANAEPVMSCAEKNDTP